MPAAKRPLNFSVEAPPNPRDGGGGAGRARGRGGPGKPGIPIAMGYETQRTGGASGPMCRLPLTSYCELPTRLCHGPARRDGADGGGGGGGGAQDSTLSYVSFLGGAIAEQLGRCHIADWGGGRRTSLPANPHRLSKVINTCHGITPAPTLPGIRCSSPYTAGCPFIWRPNQVTDHALESRSHVAPGDQKSTHHN